MANTDSASEQEAEASPDQEAAGEASEKRGLKDRISKKMLLIVGGVAILTLIGGGAGAAYFLGWFSPQTAEEVALEEVQAPVFYFDLPEIRVNLANAEQRAQYLRIQVALEMSDEETIGILEPNLPRLLDVFQTYMRELRLTDLQGSAGLFRLKHELLRRINLAIYPAEINAVLFREIIVQ